MSNCFCSGTTEHKRCCFQMCYNALSVFSSDGRRSASLAASKRLELANVTFVAYRFECYLTIWQIVVRRLLIELGFCQFSSVRLFFSEDVLNFLIALLVLGGSLQVAHFLFLSFSPIRRAC